MTIRRKWNIIVQYYQFPINRPPSFHSEVDQSSVNNILWFSFRSLSISPYSLPHNFMFALLLLLLAHHHRLDYGTLLGGQVRQVRHVGHLLLPSPVNLPHFRPRLYSRRCRRCGCRCGLCCHNNQWTGLALIAARYRSVQPHHNLCTNHTSIRHYSDHSSVVIVVTIINADHPFLIIHYTFVSQPLPSARQIHYIVQVARVAIHFPCKSHSHVITIIIRLRHTTICKLLSSLCKCDNLFGFFIFTIYMRVALLMHFREMCNVELIHSLSHTHTHRDPTHATSAICN